MPDVNIHKAKSTLSQLVLNAEERGEETTLCRAGKPVAKIIPIGAKPAYIGRKMGLLAGKIEISDDFDEFLPSEGAIFGISVTK